MSIDQDLEGLHEIMAQIEEHDIEAAYPALSETYEACLFGLFCIMEYGDVTEEQMRDYTKKSS